MKVKVVEYVESEHEFVCVTESGERVAVDPFIDALSFLDEEGKGGTFGRESVGKTFAMEDSCYHPNHNCYLPMKFVEV